MMKIIRFCQFVLLLVFVIQESMKCQATFCSDLYERLKNELRDHWTRCSSDNTISCCEAEKASLDERVKNHKILCGNCNVKTISGECCVFPFQYKNKQYYNCTTIDFGNTSWCATTSNVNIDKKWGSCNGGPGGGIPEGEYFIENVETQRYLFQDGDKISGERGSEGGWKASPKCVGADGNYYNQAYWKIIPQDGDKYLIENVETQRYLFQDGEKISGERGSEGGWKASPKCVGADANYYNRAYWKIIPQVGDKYLIENVNTTRYLLQDGEKISGERGSEGGWRASSGFESPKCVGADANYHNLAYWKLLSSNN